MKRLLALLFFVASTAAAQNAYFVDTAAQGSGTCLSALNACTAATVWTKAWSNLGDDVTFAAGSVAVPKVYSLSTGMINPTSAVKSTDPAHKVYIHCATIGGCVIDGGTGNYPLLITNAANDNIIIDGFRFRSTLSATTDTQPIGLTNTDGIEIRRFTAVGGSSRYNRMIVTAANGATNTVFQDGAIWGTGSKGMRAYSNNGPSTFRRVWVELSPSEQLNPKQSYSITYLARQTHAENLFLTWNGQNIDLVDGIHDGSYPLYSSGAPYGLQENNFDVNQAYGLISMDRIDTGTDRNCNGCYVYGSLAYLLPGFDYHTGTGGGTGGGTNALTFVTNVTGVTLKDVVVYNGATAVASGMNHLRLYNCPTGLTPPCGSGPLVATNVTAITENGTPVSNTIESQWTQTNVVSGTKASIYTSGDNMFQPAAGHGARLCYQYINGVLQDGIENAPAAAIPLFPFPSAEMATIIAAERTATGFPVVDLDAVAQQVAGVQIPAACGGPQPTPTPSQTPTATATGTIPTATPTPISPVCSESHWDIIVDRYGKFVRWKKMAEGYNCSVHPPHTIKNNAIP